MDLEQQNYIRKGIHLVFNMETIPLQMMQESNTALVYNPYSLR
ncbi:hypothetical protein CLV98_11927 [Dyadobacter jejuensis]|uniref:Uncharacterized protein n=1 Tax=Dyadobacter jejuensis TaxID=1082580 RepID=A0A316AB49_9BACT|nr:hypothetical protein CLV98_11927 [Dyadobacter jejuensis]